MSDDPKDSVKETWELFLADKDIIEWLDGERIVWGSWHSLVAMKFLEWAESKENDTDA
jgi:hypothetical protein|tara:strand:+ start:346 stop:519 length:174 start_codon:yes stop_codon:yes gene_type:complete